MSDDTNGAGQVPTASTTTDTAQGQVPAASTSASTTTANSTPAEPTTGTNATADTTDTTDTAATTTSGKPALTLEQALDALEKARKDAAKNRVDSKRLADLEETQRKADLAKLDDKQRLEKELGDLQAKYADDARKTQERIIRTEVRAAATTAGIPPELASRLIDYSEITFDDEGEPQNISDLLKALMKQWPQLAGNTAASNGNKPATPPQPTSVGATPGNPARSTSNSGALSWDYINSLTQHQYADLPAGRRQEILNWMAVNPQPARPPR